MVSSADGRKGFPMKLIVCGMTVLLLLIAGGQVALMAQAKKSRTLVEGGGGSSTVRVKKPGARVTSESYVKLAPVRAWTSRDGKQDRYIPESGGRLSALTYSPDGKWIVAGSDDGTGRVHDAATGELVRSLTGHTVSVTSVDVDAGSRRVVTGSEDQTVRIWNLDGTGEPTVLKGHQARVHAVAFAPDGRIASADEDGVVIIWKSGKPMHLTGHEGAVLAVAFSPNGQTLATAGADHAVRLWNASNGTTREVLEGHGDRVRALAFHPDGSRLASASQDKTVRIWDSTTGDSMLRILAHDKWVTSVAFSPDGTSLATASYDATAKVWRTKAPE